MNEISSFSGIRYFWDQNLCNSGHSNLPMGSMEYLNEVSRKRYFVEPHIIEFLDLENVKDKIILELKTGIGTDAALLVENGATYYGIDLSPESLKLARTRFEIFGLNGGFANISFEKFRYPSSILKPDLAYSFGALHHTVEPESALKGVVKQMKSGCKFKIMVYAKNRWKMAMIESGLDRYESQNGVPVAHTYTKEEALRLINRSGLELVDMKQDHCFMYDIEKYRNNEYVLQPYFAAMSDEILAAVKKELGWHLLINAIVPKVKLC